MADNQGYLLLYRELMNKPIWINSTPEQKVILVTLLMMANHKENEWEWKGEKYSVKEGQFISSLDKICERSGKGISIQNVRGSLARFEKLNFLTNESTKTGRLITIANWSLYQSELCKPTKQPTKSQQRGNKEVTPNKECNNDNHDNELKTPLEKAIENFKEFRVSIKKPMSEKAIELLIKNLDKMASDDETKILILERSIMNNWQGIFELNNKTNDKQQTSRNRGIEPAKDISPNKVVKW